MLRLPDSSLRRIFLQLDTDDYEQLRQVCRRFEPLVIACWRTKYKHWTRNALKDDDDNVQTFRWIATNLGEYLEKVDLMSVTAADMRLLSECQFPRVKSLHLANDCGADKTQLIAKAFPNLQRLSIEGNIDLAVISRMQQLTELNAFFYGHNAATHNFEAIFTGLRLRKLSLVHFYQEPRHYTQSDVAAILRSSACLEDIALEPQFLALLLPKLSEFPKLRTIGLFHSAASECDTNAIFEKITGLFGTRVDALISEHLFTQCVVGVDEVFHALCNLERWIVKDCSLPCGALQLDVVDAFPKLRELQLLVDYVAGKYDEDDEEDDEAVDSEDDSEDDSETADSSAKTMHEPDYDPLPLIAACRNLELLAVPRQWINTRLKLNDLHNVLLQQSPKRLLPLELHYLEDDRMKGTKDLMPIEFDENLKLLHLTRAIYAKEYKCFRPNCLSFQVILKR